MRPGIEFTSGTTFTVRFQQAPAQGQLEDSLRTYGFGDPTVTVKGSNTYDVAFSQAPSLEPGERMRRRLPGAGDVRQRCSERIGVLPVTRTDLDRVPGFADHGATEVLQSSTQWTPLERGRRSDDDHPADLVGWNHRLGVMFPAGEHVPVRVLVPAPDRERLGDAPHGAAAELRPAVIPLTLTGIGERHA